MEKAAKLLLQPSVSGVAISLLVSAGLMADILSTLCDGLVVKCVTLVSIKYLHVLFLLFDCFVCRQNVTRLKRFTRYEHYAGEVEDRCCFLNCCAKKYSV